MQAACGAARAQHAPAPLGNVLPRRRRAFARAACGSDAPAAARRARGALRVSRLASRCEYRALCSAAAADAADAPAAPLRERCRAAAQRLLASAAALGSGALLPAWQAPGAGAEAARRDAEAALAELLSLAGAARAAPPPGSDAAPPPGSDAALVGAWELAYASRGTVVTRALALPPPLAQLPRPEVSRVVQTLAPAPAGAPAGTLRADNAACLDLGPLGTWRLRALGTWTPQPAAGRWADALVAFDAFVVEAVRLGGAAVKGRVPPLRVPVPTPLAGRGATFRTLYLDDAVRVAEGAASGSRFIFTRAEPPGAQDTDAA